MPEPKSNIKTEWNLGLIYSGDTDPQIEADLKDGEKKYKVFERKYRKDQKYLKNDVSLAKALTDYENLLSGLRLARTIMYFSYRKDLNGEDQIAESMINQLSQRLTKLENSIVFFELSIAKIRTTLQKKFLKSKNLAHFRYFLECIWKRAKHDLSEPEEKILGLKFLPSHLLWVNSFDKFLSSQSVNFEGREISLGEAMPKIADLPLEKRRNLHALVIEKLKSISYFAESEINAVVINKKIDDELRGFKNPEDRTILAYQNDKETVDTLVKIVTDNFSISHRFFKLKAKLLNLPHLEYSDRNVGISKEAKEIPFEKSFNTIASVFKKTHPRFAEILESFIDNGQIDVYPKKGKTGGAYCSGNLNTPTFVMLNHTNTFDSEMTFAHEMGHAIHTELSKSQSPLYQGYSISTAEVASTLFESVYFDAVFKTLSPKEKIAALHNKINDDVSTIFRQIACYNFERDMHATIRTKGSMSKEELASCMNKHMASYLGPITKLKEDDGYYFVGWGHIRKFFYVYSYAFGQIISKALYAEYKKNPKFIKKIIQFLSAGGSMSPEAIFKSIGIDVTKPDFFLQGLKSIASDIERLEILTKSTKVN